MTYIFELSTEEKVCLQSHRAEYSGNKHSGNSMCPSETNSVTETDNVTDSSSIKHVGTQFSNTWNKIHFYQENKYERAVYENMKNRIPKYFKIISLVTNLAFTHNQSVSKAWWRHQMETFSALVALCEGNSPFNEFPSQTQWRGTLMFSLICAWTNGWANNRDAGALRCHRPIMTSL